MKKILYFIVTLSALMCSCKTEFTEKYPYELEEYNGYTVVGTMTRNNNGEMEHILTLSNGNETITLNVCEITFKRYTLGDTVNETRPVPEKKNEVGVETVEEELFKIVVIGNHEYITSSTGGICHNEDCPFEGHYNEN